MEKTLKIATVTLNPAIDQTISIPNFRAGHVNRVANSQSDPGGKGVNVASVLADYGLSLAVTGFLGAENPHLFERLFAQKGIEDRFVRIAGPTRTGIKIVDPLTQETTDINFPGQTPRPEDVQALGRIVEDLTASCAWFVLAGSVPAGLSPEIYGDLIHLIKRNGRAVALDTSGPALHQALPAAPTLIKPNNFELEEYTGRRLESQTAIIQAARELLATGIKTVIVSMGAEGAIFVAAGEVILAKPPQVVVKSTVGAGDAMVSGVVAGQGQGLPLAECARLGTAFSAGVISQVGSGLPPLAVVERFKQQVTIQKLS